MFTRLTATVTMSAPDASCAFAITAWDVYFPVPMMRRDWKVLPAMTNVSVFITDLSVQLASTHEIDDFDVVAFADQSLAESGALQDDQIVLHGDPPGVDGERFQKSCHSHRRGDVIPIAVERDGHERRHLIAL